MSAWNKLSRFGRRFLHIRQMDFEFAASQMLHLLTQPRSVYRNFLYRKRRLFHLLVLMTFSGTKDQFARDDPAFLVLLSLSLVLSSVFYAVALGLSMWGFVKFILWVIFIDCIGAGIVIASALWFALSKRVVKTIFQVFFKQIPSKSKRSGRGMGILLWRPSECLFPNAHSASCTPSNTLST